MPAVAKCCAVDPGDLRDARAVINHIIKALAWIPKTQTLQVMTGS